METAEKNPQHMNRTEYVEQFDCYVMMWDFSETHKELISFACGVGGDG